MASSDRATQTKPFPQGGAATSDVSGRQELPFADVRRMIGNRAFSRLVMQRRRRLPTPDASPPHVSGPAVQRLINVLPVAYVGNDASTAFTNLTNYLELAVVTPTNRKLKPELGRVKRALDQMHPSVGREAGTKAVAAMKESKDEDKAIANAAKLEAFITWINTQIATYQLDAAPVDLEARVEERGGSSGSHHLDFSFKWAGEQDEKKFDLDRWSRKGEEFRPAQNPDAVVKAIVEEAVDDWDTKTSIVSLLVKRLLAQSGELGGTATPQKVTALFKSSPHGEAYTKILLAAEHTIGVRVGDLTPRTVTVNKWLRTKPNEKIEETKSVNWPELLKVARGKFRTDKMKTDEVADQDVTRKVAVAAIANDAQIKALETLGAIDIDPANGTFSLNTRVVSDGNNRRQANDDKRFNFDINHFTAILFFEWKAVYDLRSRKPQ